MFTIPNGADQATGSLSKVPCVAEVRVGKKASDAKVYITSRNQEQLTWQQSLRSDLSIFRWPVQFCR